MAPDDRSLTQCTDDIASTFWTMIEENIAIICACLPMCRLPLSIILPSVFGTDHSKQSTFPQRSTEGSASNHSGWRPYSGPSKTEGINRSIVHHSDETSEEFILGTVQRHDIRGKSDSDPKAIRKTTGYDVSYERELYGKD